MLVFFLCQNIGWRYRRGRKKKPTIPVFFFCWAQFFAPPSEWRPRRPPIPPVGKTAPAHTHTHNTDTIQVQGSTSCHILKQPPASSTRILPSLSLCLHWQHTLSHTHTHTLTHTHTHTHSHTRVFLGVRM